jgi:large subunit ribosomal protein L25
MMTTITADSFRLSVRDKVGGSTSNNLRQQGMIPAILYGAGKENVPLAIDIRDVEKGLHSTGFFTTIYELNVGGTKERAMVREVQYHPVKDRPIHVDFMRVSKGAKISVRVPVVFKNELESPGIKRGGVLNVILHSIDLTCAIENIPDHLEIDLTGLEIGDSIHTDQMKFGEGVMVTHPERDITIATIVAPTVQKVTEEEVAPEAAAPEEAEGEAAPAEEEKS